MPKFDIVYILKKDIQPAELIYSLRSVEKNFPFNKVWFVCGQPKGLEPDGRIIHEQVGKTKWDWIKSSMFEVLRNDEITDTFFLFNDDFFVMKPFKGKFVNCVDGTLERRIEELHSSLGMSPYCRSLYKAQQELISARLPQMNYDVHLPMLVTKTGMSAALKSFSSPQMRSLYGNYNQVPYILHDDVKEYTLDKVNEDADFLSTNDDTFLNGKVGEFIRSSFPNPSRFEVI